MIYLNLYYKVIIIKIFKKIKNKKNKKNLNLNTKNITKNF